MPRASILSLPCNGLIGVIKPSGPTSMSIVNDAQDLFARSRLFVHEEKLQQNMGKQIKGKRLRHTLKVGQGGTLDPLADGVLVIGVGKATKKLGTFLDCTKEYETTCLLGCETDSYDSEGRIVRTAPWHHVTEDMVKSKLSQFTGNIEQTPPMFSALKMDGIPLYEYAREGKPLPRPIESRKISVHSLELTRWLGSDHPFQFPSQQMSAAEKKALETAVRSVNKEATLDDQPEASDESCSPTAFVLKMKVSGGTYVRSIVHDLAHALGSAGHVVTLTRTRQGRFTLEPEEDSDLACIPWSVFEKASTEPGEVDAEGWTEWEREVIKHQELVS